MRVIQLDRARDTGGGDAGGYLGEDVVSELGLE